MAAQVKRQRSLRDDSQMAEWDRCKADLDYFISEHVQIFNATELTWMPFDLWPAQRDLLPTISSLRYQIVLKARQLGLTWLYLAYLLWRMVFYPAATVGIWSKREEEAVELLAFRLKGMYERLPDFARVGAPVVSNNTRWELPNGSRAMAFPTTGGRSYTFSLALVDEADFQPDLAELMTAVEPTISAGGQLMLISSSNKRLPISRFKATYVNASTNSSRWYGVFLPWHARPERTQEWYEETQRECIATTGALDDVYGEYPASDAEALAPAELDKRIPARWLTDVYVKTQALDISDFAKYKLPALPNLEIYKRVEVAHKYVIGGDPAEGNPNSDPSALTVLDLASGEEVAALAGRIDPTMLASYADQLAIYYNHAAIMFERNNHGHASIAWLKEHSACQVLHGHDERAGWLSNSLGKVLMYTGLADAARDKQITIRSFETYAQLASIEAATLRAPEGLHDDRADSFALANAGRTAALTQRGPTKLQPSFLGQ